MRTKKITEIRDLLRSDPRKQPYLLYYSETYSFVHYKDRPSETLKADEVKKLIELYPGVEVVNIGRPLDEWEIKC